MDVISKLFCFGLQWDRYRNLHKHKSRREIRALVDEHGLEAMNHGYEIEVYRHPAKTLEFAPGRHVLIRGAEYVAGIFGPEFSSASGMWNDFENCRKAEEDGILLIDDIDGLEKGRYVDTKKNRKLIEAWLKTEPRYNIRYWLRTYTPWGRAYIEYYGDPYKADTGSGEME